MIIMCDLMPGVEICHQAKHDVIGFNSFSSWIFFLHLHKHDAVTNIHFYFILRGQTA